MASAPAIRDRTTHPHPAYRPSFDIRAVVAGHARLTEEQLLELYDHAPLPELGRWAFGVVQRLHPEDYRTYVIDRNINYTNICTARCTFCAFKRNDKTAADAYTLDYDAIYKKIAELVSIGGTQILMQGGMNPDLPITITRISSAASAKNSPPSTSTPSPRRNSSNSPASSTCP